MNDSTFSFRWGIPLLDDKHTTIPNFMLAVYNEIKWQAKDGQTGTGITNTEMMFIVHLASFHYESEKGRAYPALTSTLRIRMGYNTNQGIINIMQSLEHKQLLEVDRTEKGKTSTYNFAGFSKACLSTYKINRSTKVDQSTKVDDKQSRKIDDYQSTKVDTKKKSIRTKDKEQEGGASAPAPTPLVPANTPSKPKKQKRKRIKKPAEPQAGPGNGVHPAIRTWQSVRKRFPPAENYEQIISTVGDKDDDLVFWHDVLIAYAGLGWNRQSVTGPLDWFRRKEIPHLNGKPNGSSARPVSASERARTERAAKYQAYDDYWAEKLAASQAAKK